ncbi:MAG: hypothetical protein ACE5HD_04630 [Acidobacteriota bacterium]
MRLVYPRREFLRRSWLLALPRLAMSGSIPLLLWTAARGASRLVGPRDLKIDLSLNKILSLHTHLRVAASRKKDLPPELAESVRLYRHHQKLVPDPRIWFRMESFIARARDISSVKGQLNMFPLKYKMLALGKTGSDIAAAMEQAYPFFETRIWPALALRNSTTVKPVLRNLFYPHQEELLQFLFTSLNARLLPLHRVKIDLVGRYVLTGSDAQEVDGKFFTVIETDRFTATGLTETIVMMLGRIIELADKGNHNNALLLLRQRQRELHPMNPALLPRAVLYWTAGEAVRRMVDFSHVHVGKTRKIYQRAFQAFLPALEAYWNPYLDGKLGLDEAISGLTQGVPPHRAEEGRTNR